MEILVFSDLQTLFSERVPYSEEKRLGKTIIVFEPVYLKNLREALTTGCTIKMSEDSYKLTNDYIDYVDGIKVESVVLKALDDVLIDIVNCTFNDDESDCTLNSVYEFNECGV